MIMTDPTSNLFGKPLHIDKHDGTIILDCDGHIYADMRGYGRLTGHGTEGLGLSAREACRIQDARAERIVACVNGCDEAGIKNPEALARFMKATTDIRLEFSHSSGDALIAELDAALSELEDRDHD